MPAEIEAMRAAEAQAATKQLARLDAQIERLRHASFWPVRLFNRWFRLPKLKAWRTWFAASPDRAIAPLTRKLTAAQLELSGLASHPDREARLVIAAWSATLGRLETAAASPEHAGAVAELRMAELLVRGLPDTFTVFHDVTIDMGRWVYADGENRQTAQIDHLVVGPTGVFVIEVKLWSAAFAAAGEYHDPFKQVRWAGRLCHFWLTERLGQKVKVREVIATAGRLPPKPAGSYAKVCRPEEVCGYVCWFKPELDELTVASLVKLLRMQC